MSEQSTDGFDRWDIECMLCGSRSSYHPQWQCDCGCRSGQLIDITDEQLTLQEAVA